MLATFKFQITAVFFCITPFLSFSQSHFEIFGGYRIEGDSDFEGDRFTAQTSTLFFIDSFQIRSQLEQTSTPFLKVFPKPAITLGIKQHFSIGEDFKISVGLQFLIHSFEYESGLRDVETTNLGVDTTIVSSPIVPTLSGQCDQYIIDGPSFSSFRPKSQIAYLRIPLNFQFAIPGLDDFNLQVGIYFQTPFNVTTTQLRSEFEREEVNGLSICTTTRKEVKTHDPGQFTAANIGLSAGLNYMISKKLALFVSAEKTFTNVFYNDSNDLNNSTFILNSSGRVPYNPVVFTFGVSKFIMK